MGIFARELYKILYDHRNDDFSHLGGQKPRTDPIWWPLRRLAISREALNRLKSAAFSDEKRATLNPSDLEYLMEQLNLNPQERARLKAALLAQGVEIFLYDRMSEAESVTIVDITELIYKRLLERFEHPLDRVRGTAVKGELTNDQRTDLALTLADRVGDLILAAREARERSAHAEAHFWQRLILTGYQEIADLLRSVVPTLADKFEQFAQGASEAPLDASPERVEPADENADSDESD